MHPTRIEEVVEKTKKEIQSGSSRRARTRRSR
jgi:hypothetical protein